MLPAAAAVGVLLVMKIALLLVRLQVLGLLQLQAGPQLWLG